MLERQVGRHFGIGQEGESDSGLHDFRNVLLSNNGPANSVLDKNDANSHVAQDGEDGKAGQDAGTSVDEAHDDRVAKSRRL